MLDPKPQKQLSYLIFHLRSKASTCEGTSTEENISVFAHIICAKSALFKQSEQIFNNIKNDLDIRNKSASFFYYAYFLSISHQHRCSRTNIRNNVVEPDIYRFKTDWTILLRERISVSGWRKVFFVYFRKNALAFSKFILIDQYQFPLNQSMFDWL